MRRTMRRRLLFLLTFANVLSACGRGEKAQQELARQGIEYSETKFIESAREGNADAVKLLGATAKTR